MIFGDDGLFGDEPDYCRDIERPNIGALAKATVMRYLEGDPPANDAERDHEERDPAGWRRLSIQRTRWRIERHHQAQYAEMVEEMERQAMGWPASRPLIGVGIWIGEGAAPWSVDDQN